MKSLSVFEAVVIMFLITSCVSKATQQKKPVSALNYGVKLERVTRGEDEHFIWTQARAAAIPKDTPVVIMTLSKKLKSGSDVYYDLYQTQTFDMSSTWTKPEVIPSLKIHDIDNGYRRSMSDMTPQWHSATRKVLNIGKSFFYTDNSHPDRSRREVAYAVYNPETARWSAYKTLKLPELNHDGLTMMAPTAGCVQWLELPNGDILLPIFYYKITWDQAAAVSRESFDVANLMNSDDMGHTTTVVRCTFDGETLSYQEHGDEMSLKQGRGIYEPSITFFQDEYFLTLRADQGAYVTKSQDGLHFDPIKEWTFDDGAMLGSYNTQQHWVNHSSALFLVYTRRGAGNDQVFRHRAPLFMAQVDPEQLTVIRSTEKVIVPSRGVGLGNFGVTDVNEDETWITVAEYMRGEENVEADNSVFAARIQWNKPNDYLTK